MIQVFRTAIEKRKEKKRQELEDAQRSLERRKSHAETQIQRKREQMWSKKCPLFSNGGDNMFVDRGEPVNCNNECAHFESGGVYVMPDLFGESIVEVVMTRDPKCKLWDKKSS